MNSRKDNVDLICDIAELAGMFEKSAGLDSFLQTVVSIVAFHMKAAVCSIYLLDDRGEELILRATQGLSEEAVGRVKLKMGEGITGRALKELRSIREGCGHKNSFFKHIPGIQEERYEAFLAVPILRGLNRIGAMVLQDPQPNYFDENDEKALRAIGSQLATTLENARILMSLHPQKEMSELTEPVKKPAAELSFIRGQAASPGIAVGTAVISATHEINLSDFLAKDRGEFTLEAFRSALTATEWELEEIQKELGDEHEDIAGLIFSAHLLILKDDSFSGKMMRGIETGTPVMQAVVDVVNEYVHLFSESGNPALQEKVQDVLDLGHRLILNLLSSDRSQHDYQGQIIIAADLMPSDVVRFAAQRAEGLILLKRGLTSHIMILARSMQIPLVHVDEHSLLSIRDGTQIIVDGNQGTVFVQPDQNVLQRYQDILDAREQLGDPALQLPVQVETVDGVRIQVMANANLLSDVDMARDLQAEGIGLYRSEFPFIIRDNFPSEEEQFRIYSRIYEKLNGGEVIFRTLDIGGDKIASYAPVANEDNPFLGLRAIRFSLMHQDIFKQQLRAFLRAGAEEKVKIMFPMISSVDDFLRAREIVFECRDELKREGVPCNENPSLGVMIELPSAVSLVDELAAESDFISIGTNDLIQYLLAVDRTNAHVSHMYLEYHPAVLRALKAIADAGIRHGKDVSICGEIAASSRMLPFLMGIGLRRFSVDPRSLAAVKRTVLASRLSHCRELADRLLLQGTIANVKALLDAEPPADVFEG